MDRSTTARSAASTCASSSRIRRELSSRKDSQGRLGLGRGGDDDLAPVGGVLVPDQEAVLDQPVDDAGRGRRGDARGEPRARTSGGGRRPRPGTGPWSGTSSGRSGSARGRGCAIRRCIRPSNTASSRSRSASESAGRASVRSVGSQVLWILRTIRQDLTISEVREMCSRTFGPSPGGLVSPRSRSGELRTSGRKVLEVLLEADDVGQAPAFPPLDERIDHRVGRAEQHVG